MEWLHLSWPIIAWILLVTMLAGYVQGLLGVGYPMLATPLLSLVIDLRTAVIVTAPTILILTSFLCLRGGNLRVSVGRFWYMPICMIGGGLIGARIFFALDAEWLPAQILPAVPAARGARETLCALSRIVLQIGRAHV